MRERAFRAVVGMGLRLELAARRRAKASRTHSGIHDGYAKDIRAMLDGLRDALTAEPDTEEQILQDIGKKVLEQAFYERGVFCDTAPHAGEYRYLMPIYLDDAEIEMMRALRREAEHGRH